MTPKVSCIMPTCYGWRYIDTAAQCFLDQDYEGEKELIVLDNNEPLDERLETLCTLFGFKYVRTTRKPVGALRNEAIRHATGEVICIWDEDDYHAPGRISAQVARLMETGKRVTGWHNVLYWDEATGGTFKYLYEWREWAEHPPYAMGASHCFWKSWWERHPYVEQGVEDRIFSDEAMNAGQLDSTDAGKLYVARLHGNNAVSKANLPGKHKQWPAVPREEFPKEFFDAAKALNKEQ